MAGLLESADFLNLTQKAYLTLDKRQKMVNDAMAYHCYPFAEMVASDADNKITFQGGESAILTIFLGGGNAPEEVAPLDMRTIQTTEHTKEVELNWSFLENSWAIPEEPKALNAGKEKLADMVQLRTEGCWQAMWDGTEERFFDSLGNFSYLSGARPKAAGLKTWVTRDGEAVDGNASVFGISTTTYPRWKNFYAGPLGSNFQTSRANDTNRTLTSGDQVLEYLDEALIWNKFKSPPKGVTMGTDDPISRMVRGQKIFADPIGHRSIRKLLRAVNGADVMTNRETMAGGGNANPVVRGVEVEMVELLGLGASGLPATVATALNVSAGAYANTGEIFVLNLSFFKPIVHSQKSPALNPIVFDDKQRALWQLLQFWYQVGCQSRQRQTVLWGFSEYLPQ